MFTSIARKIAKNNLYGLQITNVTPSCISQCLFNVLGGGEKGRNFQYFELKGHQVTTQNYSLRMLLENHTLEKWNKLCQRSQGDFMHYFCLD